MSEIVNTAKYTVKISELDANGYIRASNVNAMVDMADAVMAQRAYEANLALVNISRSMAAKAAEIGR